MEIEGYKKNTPCDLLKILDVLLGGQGDGNPPGGARLILPPLALGACGGDGFAPDPQYGRGRVKHIIFSHIKSTQYK